MTPSKMYSDVCKGKVLLAILVGLLLTLLEFKQKNNNISAIWYQVQMDPETSKKIGKPRPVQPDELMNIACGSQQVYRLGSSFRSIMEESFILGRPI